MALKGTINGSTANKYIDSKIEWSAVQSISGNYSDVTATLYYSRNNTGYTTSGTWSGSITINGTKFAGGPKGLVLTYQSNTVAMTCTVKVPHNADGTKTITISATGSIPGTTLSSTSISGSVTLNTIPRSSSLTLSASSVAIENSITATVSRYSTSFKHTVEFYTSSMRRYSTFSLDKNTTSKTFTIPKEWSDEMAYSSSCTAYCRLTTFDSNGDQIGDYSVKSFTITIPSSVQPTSGTVTLSPSPITINGIGYGDLLVKDRNSLTVSISGAKASYGSSIKNYTFSGPSLSVTTTNTSVSVSSVSKMTKCVYNVTVTDNRERYATASASIMCHDYDTPHINAFKAYRSGTKLICSFTPVYSSVDNKNTANVTIYYSSASQKQKYNTINEVVSSVDRNYEINLGDDTSTYRVYATITDGLGESYTTGTIVVHGDARVVNITNDGTGIAFGKLAESNNLFECKWAAKFDDVVNFGNTSSQGRLYTQYNEDNGNVVYLMTGNNTSSGDEAGLAIHKKTVYVPGDGNDGVISLGSGGRKWAQVYAATGTINTSDKKQKKNIEDMSDQQAELFNGLRPVTYKMISGTSDRTHYGFVAQDIEDSLSGLGLTGQDFAGFCKDIKVDDNGNPILDNDGNVVYDYALRYSEFIALNTYMIQQLQKTIRDQQEEINSMKAEIDELKNKTS